MDNFITEDENLITAVKDGSEKAFEKLLETHKNFIASVCRKYFLVGADEEDLIQIAHHAFYTAIKSYNQNKNSSLLNYSKVVIERALINEIKKNTRKKDIPLDLFSYVGTQGQVKRVGARDLEGNSENYISIETNHETPESLAIENQNLQETLNKIKNVLSKFELDVLEYYLQGLSYKEISQKLNKPTKSIDNAILRMKNKLSFLNKEKQ